VNPIAIPKSTNEAIPINTIDVQKVLFASSPVGNLTLLISFKNFFNQFSIYFSSLCNVFTPHFLQNLFISKRSSIDLCFE